MKAPEKIYVPLVDLGVEEGICASPLWSKKDKTKEDEKIVGSIEFIRKDALIEWAEYIKTHTAWYEIEVAMDDLIDKLNSM